MQLRDNAYNGGNDINKLDTKAFWSNMKNRVAQIRGVVAGGQGQLPPLNFSWAENFLFFSERCSSKNTKFGAESLPIWVKFRGKIETSNTGSCSVKNL